MSSSETTGSSLASSTACASRQDFAPRSTQEMCSLGRKVTLRSEGNQSRISEPLGTMVMDETGIQLQAQLKCKSRDTDVILEVEPIIHRSLSRNMNILKTPYTLQVSVCETNKQKEIHKTVFAKGWLLQVQGFLLGEGTEPERGTCLSQGYL